jgi:hypothetical protein
MSDTVQLLTRPFDVEFNAQRRKDPVAWGIYQQALAVATERYAKLDQADRADLLLRAILLAVLHENGILSSICDTAMETAGRCAEDLSFKIEMVELDKLAIAARQHLDGRPLR